MQLLMLITVCLQFLTALVSIKTLQLYEPNIFSYNFFIRVALKEVSGFLTCNSLITHSSSQTINKSALVLMCFCTAALVSSSY